MDLADVSQDLGPRTVTAASQSLVFYRLSNNWTLQTSEMNTVNLLFHTSAFINVLQTGEYANFHIPLFPSPTTPATAFTIQPVKR